MREKDKGVGGGRGGKFKGIVELDHQELLTRELRGKEEM